MRKEHDELQREYREKKSREENRSRANRFQNRNNLTKWSVNQSQGSSVNSAHYSNNHLVQMTPGTRRLDASQIECLN